MASTCTRQSNGQRMTYADFSFYLNTYLGDIIEDEETFSRLEKRAGEYLDHFTFGRIGHLDVEENIRMAVCAMAEVLFWEDERKKRYGGREIASESNDGYSISFAGATDAERTALTRSDLYQAAYRYLSQTGLMDFGVP